MINVLQLSLWYTEISSLPKTWNPYPAYVFLNIDINYSKLYLDKLVVEFSEL